VVLAQEQVILKPGLVSDLHHRANKEIKPHLEVFRE
jgi:hypothetical protein